MIIVLLRSKPRAKADVLLEKLKMMHEKAMDENRTDYILKDRPRKGPDITLVAVEARLSEKAREKVNRMIESGHKVATFNGSVERITTPEFEEVQGS